MLINSIQFVIFLLAVTVFYYILPHRLRTYWILLASSYFYLSFVPIYAFVILYLIIINFYSGKKIEIVKPEKKKVVFVTAIILNLFVLFVFKYFNFVNDNLFTLLGYFGVTNKFSGFSLIVPVGISYQVFRTISYITDIYNGKQKPENNFGAFSLFLLFFPLTISGPIERAGSLLPQIREKHNFDPSNITEGLKLIAWGFFKKLVVADRIFIFVKFVLNNYENHNGKTLLLMVFLYSFQIYADFSGYTDIVRGAARMLGFNIMDNFKRPYFAHSISEFWKRWHISLSVWLRDYIYLPLAYRFARKFMNRKMQMKKLEIYSYILASMITFSICGLWHGASWTFVLWGIAHGVYLSFGRIFLPLRKKLKAVTGLNKLKKVNKFISVIFTFVLVSLSWVLFFANSPGMSVEIFRKIIKLDGKIFFADGLDGTTLFYSIAAVIILLAVEIKKEYFPKLFNRIYKYKFVRQISYAVLLILILLLGVFGGDQFIYYQF